MFVLIIISISLSFCCFGSVLIISNKNDLIKRSLHQIEKLKYENQRLFDENVKHILEKKKIKDLSDQIKFNDQWDD